ncbi:MAG: pyridoxal phosphate-dependent aminotransferase, partial [Methanosarcinales archaeon]
IISERCNNIKESATLKFSNMASELKRQGKDVISLSLGEPDFTTPKHICDAALTALDKGETHYTPTPGIPELREEIANKLKKENGLEVKSGDIIATTGAKHAIFMSVQAVLNSGDEAIIFDPSWVTYEACIKFACAKPIWIPTDPSKRFKPKDITEYISPKTKLMILNSPCNPTGMVHDKAFLKEIRDIAVDKDIIVISDEIYEKIIYDKEHISIGSFDGMQDRTITINGFSKAYAMTGWRLGYVAAPDKDIYKAMLKLQSHSVSHPASFAQYAGVVALKSSQDCVSEMCQKFKERRDIITSGLKELGIPHAIPEGAFYIFADVSKFGSSNDVGMEVSEKLLKEAYVAVTPGSAFGPNSKNYVRISYAASEERIKEALNRIENLFN